MRVMVVRPGPRFSVADVSHGLVKGLRQAGAEVYDFAFDSMLDFYGAIALKTKSGRYKACFDAYGAAHQAGDRLQAAAYRFWPDVIILVSCFWVPPEVYGILRSRRHKIVAWFTESPYEDDKQLNIAPHVDYVALNDPLNLERFRAANPRSYYYPHSYDPDIHKPGPGRDDWRCDVGWAGTAFPSRYEFLEQVDWSGVDLKVGGMWKLAEGDGSPLIERLIHPVDECLDNADAVTLYQSSKLSFNLYRKETTPEGDTDGVAVGPREVELAATGTFFLREPRPEGDDLFPMLPTFTTPDEFTDVMRWWLAHDMHRVDAAAEARRAVADRTFLATARRLLGAVTSQAAA